MSAHVLAIDQGTTNTKALIVNSQGVVVARAARPVGIHFPQPGWVEQDAAAIWRSVTESIDGCLRGAAHAEIAAVAVTNQRESCVVWDRKTGEPAGPVVVWQCRRTAAFCDDLRARGLQPEIEARTGLTIDPLFSASKLRWLLDHVPDGHVRAADGALCAGTIDSWLLWQLTRGALHACDASNASRTQLLNLRTREWDPDLLGFFGVPHAALPQVRPSSGVFGMTTGKGCLPSGVPVAGVAGDSHAALFGHAGFTTGRVKATYGTGSSLMTIVSTPLASRHGLSTTVAWALGDRTTYALEGNITVTGSALDWLAHVLGLADAGAVFALAATVPDAGGAHLVPAFAGLGAPHWDAHARGLLSGLTRGTTAAHLARAGVESIAWQIADVFEAVIADAGSSDSLLVDGGATRNDMLMQFQADVLGCPVVRSDSQDVSAIGAAWLAGLAIGLWPSVETLAALPRPVTRFEPEMSAAERDRRAAGWRDAVARARRPSLEQEA